MDVEHVVDQTLITAPRYVIAAWPQDVRQHRTEILVVGGGAAGLAAALQAASHVDVTLLTREQLPTSNSARAQGGIAAALDTEDSPTLHDGDTLVAGAGLSDPAAVAVLTQAAPRLMRELDSLGVPFEQDTGAFVLGLEGGHSRRRILHVGDATGRALTDTLIAHTRGHPRIRICEGYQAVDLLDDLGCCTGVLARDSQGGWHCFRADTTILATGGAGALYGLTSNQPDALGEGVALAFRAGAEVADMEFVQFHPTVLRASDNQGFLISEAVRGEGGRLITPGGQHFMPVYDPRAELAPRDVVTRGIFAAMQREGVDHVLLDLTHLSADYLQRRFPTIYARCHTEGFNLAVEPVPVAPAAHYLMGGIRTDLAGATSLPGLYAVGECACTGVHGANRLASNSLLECLVFGRRAAEAALNASEPIRRYADARRPDAWCYPVATMPPRSVPTPDAGRRALVQIMRSYASPLRSGSSLEEALCRLTIFPNQATSFDTEALTLANAALTACLIVTSALLRTESRGAHFRTDFPTTQPEWQVHTVLSRGQEPFTVATVAAMELEMELA